MIRFRSKITEDLTWLSWVYKWMPLDNLDILKMFKLVWDFIVKPLCAAPWLYSIEIILMSTLITTYTFIRAKNKMKSCGVHFCSE